MATIAQCTLPNFVFSGVVVACALLFVVDVALREVDAVVARTRLATLVASALHMALFASDGDAGNTITSTILTFLYGGVVFATLLYYCQNFHRVYLNLPAETQASRILRRIVKLYPAFRTLLVTIAVVQAIFISVYPINVTFMASLVSVMITRVCCIIPTFVLMIRISLALRTNRLSQELHEKGRGQVTQKLERQLMTLGIIALVLLMYITAQNVIQLIDLGEDLTGPWQQVCSVSNAGGFTRNIAMLIGLVLIRSPRARWRSWSQGVIDRSTSADEKHPAATFSRMSAESSRTASTSHRSGLQPSPAEAATGGRRALTAATGGRSMTAAATGGRSPVAAPPTSESSDGAAAGSKFSSGTKRSGDVGAEAFA